MLIAISALVACVADEPYVCLRTADCQRGDQQGVCESTGFCSFEDASCGEGVRRYGALASPELAATCVPCVAELSAGDRHTCARTQRGELYCWGDNGAGQIGDGSQGRALSPVALTIDAGGAALEPASALASGTEHGCAVLGDQGLFCWGDNDSGELGNPDVLSAQRRPRRVIDAGGLPVRGVAIAAGLSHSCAVNADGLMSCWGSNSSGQLAASQTTVPSSPSPRPALDDVAYPVLGHGAFHTCAVRGDASLWCWGGNNEGQVGNGSLDNVSRPVAVLGSGSVRSASIGEHGSCAVSLGGEAHCWGANADGQVGDGTTTTRPQPTSVSVLSEVRSISVGGAHACAIRGDHSLWCWGRGSDGQLGPDITASTQPVSVRSTDVLAVAAGAAHTCMLEADGVVRCFGANAAGQLGNGNSIPSAEPVAVGLSCR